MKAITLTEKLAEKAKANLNNDLSSLRRLLGDNPIAQKMIVTVNSKGDTRTDTLNRLFAWDCPETKAVIEKMLPDYIERETNEFIAKVDRLSDEVEDLQNQLNN